MAPKGLFPSSWPSSSIQHPGQLIIPCFKHSLNSHFLSAIVELGPGVKGDPASGAPQQPPSLCSLPAVAPCGSVWLSVTLCDSVWLRVAPCDSVWLLGLQPQILQLCLWGWLGVLIPLLHGGRSSKVMFYLQLSSKCSSFKTPGHKSHRPPSARGSISIYLHPNWMIYSCLKSYSSRTCFLQSWLYLLAFPSMWK